jgi:3-oxoacyl-[acyl-carrier protein] reductase
MANFGSAMQPGSELAGKVALVTGASRNIGRAIALSLAAGGASIAVNTRASREAADSVVQEIRSAGAQAEVFLADVAEREAVNRMVEGVLQRFGRIDILVLNAAVRKDTSFSELEYDEWRRILAIVLDGAFYCTKACVPAMLKAGGGSIVTLGGMTSLSGTKSVHGSAAKHGLLGITRSLAHELAPQGIRVNCVSPGQIDTERGGSSMPRADQSKQIPLGRKGQPDEIAAAVRFLCGPGASYITGQLLNVNGGRVMA